MGGGVAVAAWLRCADLYMGLDDADAAGDEAVDPRGGAELYNCPFCGEDFDFVSFCCHIDDEHAVEAKTGVRCFHSFLSKPCSAETRDWWE